MTGCRSNEPKATPQRTAVLRFENLSSSGVEDWQGRALSELLKRGFHAGRIPHADSPAPGISTERLAAINSGATRLIFGYFIVQGDALTVTAMAENTITQKITAPLQVSGSVAATAEAIAGQLGGDAASISKTIPAALKEYSLATDSSGPDAVAHYEATLKADPNFGPAYLGLSQTAAALNYSARAQAVLNEASAHAAHFTAQDRADIQLESASLRRDAPARVQALQAELALSRNDPETLRALADAELSTRKSAEAAKHYRELSDLSPEDGNLRILLAYACLSAGDESGARAAALEYRRLRPGDPNAFDTQGDVELAFGHLAEAEKIYLASPDPAFQDSSPTWKAAHARLFTGDAAGASAIFDRHRKMLTTAGSPAAGFRTAEWQYQTGHHSEGISAMADFAAQSDQPDMRAAAYTQAAIWAVLQHENAAAIKLSDLAMHPPRSATFLLAALARFLAQPPANSAEWQHRAESNFNGQNVADVRRLALGLALALSNNSHDSLPVWKHIYESTPASDPAPLYLYGWSLLETGHRAQARPLLQLNPIPSPGVAPSFEALYIPALFEWRKSSLRQ